MYQTTFTFKKTIKPIKNEKIICSYCDKEIKTYKCVGEWRAQNPGAEFKSFYMHQLLTSTCDLKDLIKQSKSNVEAEIEQFYNQGLGLAYEPKGSKLIDTDFEKCKGTHKIGEIKKDDKSFGGFDVGKKIHYEIRTEKDIIDFGEVDHFFKRDDENGGNSAEEIIERYDLDQFAIDAITEDRNCVRCFLDEDFMYIII